jgi:hypothetical protein
MTGPGLAISDLDPRCGEGRQDGAQAEAYPAPDRRGAGTHAKGEESTRDLTKSYGVSVSTISRLVA